MELLNNVVIMVMQLMLTYIFCSILSHCVQLNSAAFSDVKQKLQAIILATAMLVSCSHVTVLGKATECSITFYLVHTTLPNYNWVTRISAHTHSYEISNPSMKKIESSNAFLLCFVKPRCAKGIQDMLQNRARVGAYRVVQTLLTEKILF